MIIMSSLSNGLLWTKLCSLCNRMTNCLIWFQIFMSCKCAAAPEQGKNLQPDPGARRELGICRVDVCTGFQRCGGSEARRESQERRGGQRTPSAASPARSCCGEGRRWVRSVQCGCSHAFPPAPQKGRAKQGLVHETTACLDLARRSRLVRFPD